jgi:hypothetical protein
MMQSLYSIFLFTMSHLSKLPEPLSTYLSNSPHLGSMVFSVFVLQAVDIDTDTFSLVHCLCFVYDQFDIDKRPMYAAGCITLC